MDRRVASSKRSTVCVFHSAAAARRGAKSPAPANSAASSVVSRSSVESTFFLFFCIACAPHPALTVESRPPLVSIAMLCVVATHSWPSPAEPGLLEEHVQRDQDLGTLGR